MKHPIFPIDGVWCVESIDVDGKQVFSKFDSYIAAFDFYRQSIKNMA
ncbi:hypothetical protein [Caudoviricetes sp.]|nr:hypothetical protein [Caudoviricetes sp.]